MQAVECSFVGLTEAISEFLLGYLSFCLQWKLSEIALLSEFKQIKTLNITFESVKFVTKALPIIGVIQRQKK